MTQVISKPVVNVSKIPSTQTQSNEPQRVLLVGQKVAAGTATAGALITEIANDNSEDTLFGASSQLAGMVRAFKKINQVTRLDAIPLDDNGAGVAATGTIAFTGGPATTAGTITVNIGSRSNHSYDLAVAVGDTITDIGDALDVAVLADTDSPFSSSNAAGTVTITALNDGTEGNFIGLEVTGFVDVGIGVTVTGMASGATDPSLTNVYDVIDGERYQTIVQPATYGYSEITTLLEARFNATNNILDGVAIVSKTDTLANLKANEGTENSQTLVAFGNKQIDNTYYKGSAIFELDTIIASYFAAIRSLRLTAGANISNYVVTTALLDQIGGSKLASLPYFNTPFSLLPIIDPGIGFTQTEIGELEDVGVSVMGNNTSSSSIISGGVHTTYLTDAASNTDTTWEFLNYVDTASNIAEFFFNNLKSDYNQSRLTEGDLIAGISMANEAKIRASMVSYYNTLSDEDYVLVQAGADAIKFFKENLTVSLALATGTVTITGKTPIVTQARVFTVPFQVVFSTNS